MNDTLQGAALPQRVNTADKCRCYVRFPLSACERPALWWRIYDGTFNLSAMSWGGRMTVFEIAGVVIFLVAVFGYLNYRFIHLPDVIGITAFGMAASLIVAILGNVNQDLADAAHRMIGQLDFSGTLLHGVLGMLLFAGSLHIRLEEIAREKWIILILATIGVLCSTVIVGSAFHLATQWIGQPLPLLHCMLFGALISPTDPVAVLAILKRVGVPKSLEARISGESLFNDGTGVVAFLTLLGLASGSGESNSFAQAGMLFATEVIGGVAFGALTGYLGFLMLRDIDSYPVEILITLAMAISGYLMAEALGISAPIAVVLMGLITGNRGKHEAMSPETRERLFGFWDVLDELLNLLLFGLIGLEMMTLAFSGSQAVLGAMTIVIVLLARGISITSPMLAIPRLRPVARTAIPIMTWGGLRGGISVALALSLPALEGREQIISSTYIVVIFSIMVQALTLERLAKHLLHKGSS